MRCLTLLGALTLVSIASAVNPNEQSCQARDSFGLAEYMVSVGVAYNGGRGCNDIKRALTDALRGDQNYGNFFCSPLENGRFTYLAFQATQNRAGAINGALHRMYPMVNGFNCPNY